MQAFGGRLIYRRSVSNYGTTEKTCPLTAKQLVTAITTAVFVAKKRQALLVTVQFTLYSIVIGILVASGQQETKTGCRTSLD